MIYLVREKQNLLDIAMQLYGDLDGVWKLLDDNPSIGLDSELATAQELVVDPAHSVNPQIQNYFKTRNLKVVTGPALPDEELQPGEGFDTGFLDPGFA